MAYDPIKYFYLLGYQDVKEGKKRRRVPYMYKCAYTSGRYDAVTNKAPRYNDVI